MTAHNTCHARRKSACCTPAKRFLTAIPMADEKMAEFLNVSNFFISSSFISTYRVTNGSVILERRNAENIGKNNLIALVYGNSNYLE